MFNIYKYLIYKSNCNNKAQASKEPMALIPLLGFPTTNIQNMAAET